MSRRFLFLLGILFQLLAIFGLFIPHVMLMASGTTVRLKTMPVDPYSLFRGTYVNLQYEVGQELPIKWNDVQPLFVVLEKSGEFYERVEFSEEKPDLQPGQVCLRGQGRYGQLYFPDIAQYFVEEGEGKVLEQEQNARRLYIDVVVNDDCKARIKNIILGPQVPITQMDLTRPVPVPAEFDDSTEL